MVSRGHLHHVRLVQRDGESYLALDCGMDYREACEQLRLQKITTMPIHQIVTPIAATDEIVTAFNQGNSSFLRENVAARTIRLALLQFLQEEQERDPYCGIVESDLRRHAAIPLCVE